METSVDARIERLQDRLESPGLSEREAERLQQQLEFLQRQS